MKCGNIFARWQGPSLILRLLRRFFSWIGRSKARDRDPEQLHLIETFWVGKNKPPHKTRLTIPVFLRVLVKKVKFCIFLHSRTLKSLPRGACPRMI
jgi:hypothetical protein